MLRESQFVKLRVSTPVEFADTIREVLGRNGAGIQGLYSYCSGSYPMVGRFIPMSGSSPSIGQIGELERVEEEMIEVLCDRDIVREVISAVKKVHPYEEPAIDIIPRLEFF